MNFDELGWTYVTHHNHPDHLTTWLNELNRPQIDQSQPPMNLDELSGGRGAPRGKGVGVGYHNFGLLFYMIYDLWSKKICRP